MISSLAVCLFASIFTYIAVSAPVKSILDTDGTEQQEVVASYTAHDYIQDGLIAMWDGIENVDWNTHDDSPEKWIDTGIVPQLLGVSKISIKPTVKNTVPWGCQNFTEISSYGRYFTDKGLGVRLIERLTPAMISKSTERQNKSSPMEPYQDYQIIFSSSPQAEIAGYLEEATLAHLDS